MGGHSSAPTKTALINFAENTSAHGIKKLTDRHGIVLKIVWLILLLGAAGMIFLQVSQLIQLYLRHPVLTKTSIETSKLQFPSVTFCNLNPVLHSKAKEHIIYKPVHKIADYLSIPLTTFDDKISDELLVIDNNTFTDSTFKSDDLLEEALLDFKLHLQSVPRDTLMSISQPFNKFVISCLFGGVECDISNFTTTFDNDFGICYTFPNKADMPEGITVFNAGPFHGLKLILNVDQKEYVPFITTSAGVRIQVHEFGSKPHLQELGQSLSTGFETQIGVKPVIYRSLPHPHGNCDDSGVFESLMDCERECVEGFTEKMCGCTRPTWLPFKKNISMNVCESKDIPCMQQVLDAKQNAKISCKCEPTCRVYDFETQFSMTRWPASHYEPAVRFKLKKWSSMENTDMFTGSEIRDNLLTASVFYSRLSLQTIEEEAAYQAENLLSDIGGQLGLWLGISVLSLCEVFELFYLLMINCCNNRSKVINTEG